MTALTLADGRYAVEVSETRPGDVFVSKSLDGPWEHLGSITVATNDYSRTGRMSNAIQRAASSRWEFYDCGSHRRHLD